VLFGVSLLTFLRNVAKIYTRLYGVTSQTTVLFVVTAMKTSDLAINIIFWEKNNCQINIEEPLYLTVTIAYQLTGHRNLSVGGYTRSRMCHYSSSAGLSRRHAQPVTPHKSVRVSQNDVTDWLDKCVNLSQDNLGESDTHRKQEVFIGSFHIPTGASDSSV
jgi:hypothetical protein